MKKAVNKPSLKSIITEPFMNRNYFKFVLFATFFSFGVNISGPFFNIYMIEELKMNYFMINFSTQVMASIATIICVRKWGVLADRFGNKPITFISSILIIATPLVWVFTSSHNIVMVFVANIVAGIGWSGYNLAVFNLSVWLAPEKNRSAYTACFALMTSSIGTAAAYLCGGYYLEKARPFFEHAHIPFVMGAPLSAFTVLFAISALMRLAAVLMLYPKFHENNAVSARRLVRTEINKLKKIALR
jgi:MFS family permease